MSSSSQMAYLIVNADDYGSFECVSRGILDSARNGIVTATGIFANTEHFDEHSAWLRHCEALDIGVHLNLTARYPLTEGMRKKLGRWGGRFPEKFTMAVAIAVGAIKIEDVEVEWRAQIERCLEKRLRLRFLNSHEHIHMLPALFPVVQGLAEQYGIPHIRFPAVEPFRRWSIAALVRDMSIKSFSILNRHRLRNPAALFFGMGVSGKLGLTYIKQRLPKLKAGYVYELMCHPGYFDRNEICDSWLRNYHDWEGELNALTNPAVRELCDSQGIRIVGYRDIKIVDGHLTVVTEESLRWERDRLIRGADGYTF